MTKELGKKKIINRKCLSLFYFIYQTFNVLYIPLEALILSLCFVFKQKQPSSDNSLLRTKNRNKEQKERTTISGIGAMLLLLLLLLLFVEKELRFLHQGVY